jgi:hypothetical protein
VVESRGFGEIVDEWGHLERSRGRGGWSVESGEWSRKGNECFFLGVQGPGVAFRWLRGPTFRLCSTLKLSQETSLHNPPFIPSRLTSKPCLLYA